MLTTRSVNVGARLDRLPIGSFHRRLFFLIAAGAFFDGFDLFLAGGVLGAFVQTDFSSLQQNADFVFMTFVGMVIGAWGAGILGDRYGRRFSYQFNLALFGFASIAAGFVPNMPILIVLRFIMGIGLGAELVIAYPMLSEFVPPASRGRLISMLAASTNAAAPIASFLGYLIIPTIGWRYMFFIAGAGALIVWVARKTMPESPRWLESKGMSAEAEAVVSRIEDEARKKDPLLPVPAEVTIAEIKPVPFTVVFQKPLLQRTLIGMVIHLVIAFVVFGFFGWLPTFFVKQGSTIASSLGWTTIIGLGAPIGALIGAAVADRFGRKPSIIVACLSSAFFGAIYPFVGDGIPLAIVGFLLMASTYVISATGFALYVAEMYPTWVRLRGVAVCNTTGRICTAVLQYLIVWIYGLGGVTAVVAVIVVLLLTLALVMAVFAVETKDRSLETIASDGSIEKNKCKLGRGIVPLGAYPDVLSADWQPPDETSGKLSQGK